MSWPTQEQFDRAHKLGTEYALAQRENGATEAREAPLSGEWADDPTTRTVAAGVGYSAPDDWEPGLDRAQAYMAYEDGVQELADAWERGYFDAWAHSE